MISFPNAKINLGLNIVEKRPDGYHNLETIFLPVGLHDALEIIPAHQQTSPYEWHQTGIAVDAPAVGNIVIKALMLMRERHPKLPPIKVHLHKAIPFGAGLGGGSADGAFMLKMLNDYFNLDESSASLEEMAAHLGADCAFFIENKPAFGTGIGNILEPTMVSLKGYYLALVIPPIHVSTPDAYRYVKPAIPKIPLKEAILCPIETWKDTVVNDFEMSVFQKFPEIANVKAFLYEQGAVYASMSGSGAAVFGIFTQKPEINKEGWFVHVGEMT
ncbi:4-diphosphocytidyl-2-C-methyl-D-erythritol kinase [Breznakibacter xylanolyticus]|uniref:4-diphosphocytidyl-2-C-methyl-D-erythritol kinase n=1 Tax=Breznakibacter xylanolyticus TaxID=990 RepID=A0A2W7NJZ0_9BACT|nr:4-(cytidine 5'-diphospho)-2-C-methyl-D-erythritol kinase [Breznakibacter xylanolyticus]PZX20745.1 4-diphosphocytidyl-2-C-methyl-D-erythritol kinase [Breznakibacter xylanolyticus]